jgi:uncharacterized protein YciI
MRFAYVYFMKRAPERERAVAPEHAGYWRGLELRQYLGGPFGDRSGGLITFENGSWEEAEQLVTRDPFAREGLLEDRWLNEWKIE